MHRSLLETNNRRYSQASSNRIPGLTCAASAVSIIPATGYAQ
jgi:hypothetical protein